VALRTRDDFLYLTTWNARSGTRFYRSRDGVDWSPLNRGGFGNPNNVCGISIAWDRGWTYVGTWNREDGGELFRVLTDRLDGRDPPWERCAPSGFGDRRNRAVTSLAAFNGHLYAGCYNPDTGPEVWRSPDGAPGSWRQVNRDGWGLPSLSDATRMLVHDGFLYVSTESLRVRGRGCRIFRTAGRLAPPFDQWEEVCPPGFGSPRNINVWGLGVEAGRLIAATWNSDQGFEVWRATPGRIAPFPDWERLAHRGFGDERYIMGTAVVSSGGAIYVSAIGEASVAGDPFRGGVKVTGSAGGILMRMDARGAWSRITAPGFLAPPVLGATALAPFRGKLFIGVMAQDRALEIWSLDTEP